MPKSNRKYESNRLSEEDVRDVILMDDDELREYLAGRWRVSLSTLQMFMAFRDASKTENEYNAYSRLMRIICTFSDQEGTDD